MTRALLLALAACNQVYGLEETQPLDAFVPPDQDSDGTPDSIDNCIDLANDQSDIDEDRLGDHCDNCPLVANRFQENVGDTDAVGDACDPHARIDGDCLVLVDTFTTFGDPWQGNASIAQGDGVITVTPASPDSVVTLRLAQNGTFDVQLLAAAQLASGAVFAMSNLSTGTAGYGCGMQFDANLKLFRPMAQAGSTTATYAFPGFLSTAPVNTRLLLQLISPHAADGRVLCLATYGLAPGASSWLPASGYNPGPGAPGIVVRGEPVTLDAFALYQSDLVCPTTQYR